MNRISIQLEIAELENVRRHAEAFGVDSEDLAYAALRRLMNELELHPQEIDREILNLRAERAIRRPFWDNSGHSHHPFEDAGNDYAVPGL